MSNWQPRSFDNLTAEQSELLREIEDALGGLSHDRKESGRILIAPATDGAIRLIMGVGRGHIVEDPDEGPDEGADDEVNNERSATRIADLVAERLAAADLRLTSAAEKLAAGYAVRVTRRPGPASTGTPIQVRMPDELLARLDARAREAGTSRAGLVRELVDAGLSAT